MAKRPPSLPCTYRGGKYTQEGTLPVVEAQAELNTASDVAAKYFDPQPMITYILT